MKWADIKNSFSDFWKEFKRVKSGIFGLVLFIIFLLIVIFEPLVLPFGEVNDTWRDITYWEDNPKSAQPEWTNFFRSEKLSTSSKLTDPEVHINDMGALKMETVSFKYDYQFSGAPKDIVLKAHGTGNPLIVLSVTRPDGEEIELLQKPLFLEDGSDVRISLAKDSRDSVYEFARDYESRVNVGKSDPKLFDVPMVLFSKAQEGILRDSLSEALKGEYTFSANIILQNENDTMDDFSLIIPGQVYGVLGTDAYKRDLWSGVLAGVKWALLIGILTAIVSVSIGVIFGVVSAYYGGWKDSLMQRIFEIFRSIPLLPLLIVLSAVFKPSLFMLIGMMCIFFWTGPVKTVRSMAMQIKEETYIEATRALGGGHGRIIFKHMVPLLIPYSFASMALFIPGAIVYEATISLLGLGDATIVTWGQILSDALKNGAVLNGLWWWVVPPGLCIALMGMAFAFIGFAMDKILHPKLRTR